MNHLLHPLMRFSVAAAMWGAASVALAQTIDVYKFANCGCCTKWVEHLRSHGFTPQVHAMSDLHPIRRKLGVPQKLAACHTALVDGYVIEGHVPADLIRKFLKEKPHKARGLVVPAMPAGSPGMEGGHKVDYEVLLLNENGSYSIYAKR